MPQSTDLRRPDVSDDHRRRSRPDRTEASVAASRTVVVGYDGSDASRRALSRAAEAAGSRGRVVVVTAVQPADPLAPEDEIESATCDPRRLVEEARDLLRDRDLHVSTQIAEADPAEALAVTAAEMRAALIVVGARGRSYFARALRGSVGEKLVARAPCDLLVAR